MSEREDFTSPAEIRHRIGTDGAFNLNNVSGYIRVRGIAGDEVTVVAHREGGDDGPLPLIVRRSDRSLHVEVDEKGPWLSFRRTHGVSFDVHVPAGARVEITAVSSDIEAHGLTGDQIYRTVSGDLVIDGARGRVSATTVSGDVQATGVEPIEMNVTTTSGDIEAHAPTFAPVRLRTVSGDMTLRGRFAVGPQHTVESVSGDLLVDAMSGLTVDTKRGLDFSKRSNQPQVVGDGSAQLRFRSLSGDLQLTGPHATGRAPDVGPYQAPSTPTPPPGGDDSLEVLRALERGEIDVDEAARRLEGAGHRG